MCFGMGTSCFAQETSIKIPHTPNPQEYATRFIKANQLDGRFSLNYGLMPYLQPPLQRTSEWRNLTEEKNFAERKQKEA